MLKNEKLLKNKNIIQILNLIRKSKGISRSDLARKLNLTPASISKISKKLIDANYIYETGLAKSNGGRRAKILQLNYEIANIISVYLAPDYIKIIMYDLNLEDIYIEKIEFWINTKENLIKIILNLIEKAIKISKNKILGIGIALTGIVDNINGISLYSPHYKLSNIKLPEIIEKKFNIKTYLENDVRAMAIGEKNYGIAKNISDFVLINIGNGVGSALYLNDKIYSGHNFGAGEFGHIPIEGNDLRCTCGKKGCLETLITNDAIENKYYELTGNNINIKKIYDLYKNKDNVSIMLIEFITKILSKGILSIVNLLNPKLIIIASELNIDYNICKILHNELNKISFGNLSIDLEICSSAFKENNANIGATSLVIDNFFKYNIKN